MKFKLAAMVATFLFWALAVSLSALPVSAAEGGNAAERAKSAELMKQGNWRDAFDLLAKIVVDPNDDPKQAGNDLKNALTCLQRLGREPETDDLFEKAVSVHAVNWRLQHEAAQALNQVQHAGFVISGKFSRGNNRGGGQYVNSTLRDRVRSLQLMTKAAELSKDETDKNELSQFYLEFANFWQSGNGYYQSWRMQDLTDLTQLPDFMEGWNYYSAGNGAPVNPDGTPVYHALPKSLAASISDGERWRWCLMQAQELSPAQTQNVRYQFATFLMNQFDVRTASEYGRFFGAYNEDGAKQAETNPFVLSSLTEEETIARLATGVKRFKLPDEFNFIKLLKQNVAEKGPMTEASMGLLAQIFTDRQQYDTAAGYWQQSIVQFGDPHQIKKHQLDQIIGNWGMFEGLEPHGAGAPAQLDFRFRNGKKVSFEAQEVNVKKLLDDVKAYINSKPKANLDWQRINLGDIGMRLVQQSETQYLGAAAGSWNMDLEPREKHFDRRVSVVTPLKKAGAYLVTATMENGNSSRVMVWIDDTALVQKQLDKSAYYFVADAVSGKPVPGAAVEFFGFHQTWQNNQTMVTETDSFTETADADGQLIPKHDLHVNTGYNWLLTATTADGRFAYSGFNGIWFGNAYDAEYNQTKVFTITDRPVYRPSQTVKFKLWVGQAKYDLEGKSPFATWKYNVEIHSPKGEKLYSKEFTADEYGGFDGEFALGKEADLGSYNITIPNMSNFMFRVEEYKKPEFEVKIDAPVEPVMLGEKIAATMTAKYYFGAPVADARVKFKVMRTSHSAQWFPVGRWDWLFQPGYWWFAADYNWYPGWRFWGVSRPHFFWWGRNNWEQPEIVLQSEAPIAPDGTMKIEIDTALTKLVHGDTDHKYEIVAEVTDASRRTITGAGTVLVARNPFKVYAWVDRGHYHTNDDIVAEFSAQTLDNKPVQGKGVLKLMKVTYAEPKAGEKAQPTEKEVQKWDLDTDAQGKSRMQMKASEAGQYRLSYTVTDAKEHTIEGGYVFTVIGAGFNGTQFRFNDLELVTDKREYKPGDTVNLMINTDRADTTVLLFIRPSNGVCLPPKVLRMAGKSVIEPIEVIKKDMPNFFVEAVTVSDCRVHSEMREVIVPPESRVLNVEVHPSAAQYKPGEKATVDVKVTEINGEPFAGSAVLTVYDKAVEYISGGSNVPDIKKYYWEWRRRHTPSSASNLVHQAYNLLKRNEIGMGYLGVFGNVVVDELEAGAKPGMGGGRRSFGARSENLRSDASKNALPAAPAASAKAMEADGAALEKRQSDAKDKAGEGAEESGEPPAPNVEATVRKNFADTAYWGAALNIGANGMAKVELPMPENLTTWKFKVWTLGQGTRVGQGEAEAVTTKNLLVRLQAPRFFTQKDEVVISANVHNYLKTAKRVQVSLEMEGGVLEAIAGGRGLQESVEIESSGEKRVDWRVKVIAPGQALVRVKALTDEESDAMQMTFPAYIHGMEKVESFSGAIRPDKESASLAFTVPAERRAEDSRVEIRYSPTLAGAMVDAIPYLVDYPYGCTEQTLSRFLPAVITQKVLLRMNLDLKDIKAKITNLNAQEIGDDQKRAEQWGRAYVNDRPYNKINPVFDDEELKTRVKASVTRLQSLQLTDGSWGWFGGWGEFPSPHETAYVVHGLQIAKGNDVSIDPNMLERGQQWLKSYQESQLALLRNAATKTHPYKEKADNLDAFVAMVLTDASAPNKEMIDRLYEDRNELTVYGKSILGLIFSKTKDKDRLAMVMKNIDQFLVQDEENQTAYLKLPESNAWWYWYGSEYEAQGYYLKLLAATEPKSDKASRLVKYIINNRKHATYWNSTRDTAICVEALADYLTASGEDGPDMKFAIFVDGKKAKDVEINASNLFSFDNKLVITGDKITSGKHTVEFKKTGKGPIYFNAYVTNFTMEDHITKAGLEVKVTRKYYKLNPVDKTIKAEGSRGQSVDQKVEKYEREELPDLATLKSGELVEVELSFDSKNDYEYILFEDMKPAGFEPVDVQSGYTRKGFQAYMELRDERVCFFCRTLPRGANSIAYRMRAEIPGSFNALPTKASGMYAPELRANSDEIKLNVKD